MLKIRTNKTGIIKAENIKELINTLKEMNISLNTTIYSLCTEIESNCTFAYLIQEYKY